ALALLKESLETSDEPRRRQIFAELHGLMKAQVPTIGLYFEPTAAATQTKVKGWQTWPVDRPITWGVWKQ
ncbi:MAG: ABC transporter substrate-binding protein, partial [Ferrovibrionaceae bacterium]